MKPARTPRLFVAAAVALAGLIAPGLMVRAGDDIEKCTIATQGDSPVAKACQEGGIRLAKRKMKELVRAAREKGMVSECTDCHDGIDAWTLTKGANDKFRRLIDLSR
jgi:hypothetical protein